MYTFLVKLEPLDHEEGVSETTLYSKYVVLPPMLKNMHKSKLGFLFSNVVVGLKLPNILETTHLLDEYVQGFKFFQRHFHHS